MYKGLSEKMPQRRPEELTDEELKEIGAKEFNKILKKSGQLWYEMMNEMKWQVIS